MLVSTALHISHFAHYTASSPSTHICTIIAIACTSPLLKICMELLGTDHIKLLLLLVLLVLLLLLLFLLLLLRCCSLSNSAAQFLPHSALRPFAKVMHYFAFHSILQFKRIPSNLGGLRFSPWFESQNLNQISSLKLPTPLTLPLP